MCAMFPATGLDLAAAASLSADTDAPASDEVLASPYIENRHPHCSSTLQQPHTQQPLTGDATCQVALNLNTMPLAPTMPFLSSELTAAAANASTSDGNIEDPAFNLPEQPEEDVIGVRYFIRLILEEQQQEGASHAKAYWNTHEIFLFRSR